MGDISGSCPDVGDTADNVIANVDPAKLPQELLPTSSSQVSTYNKITKHHLCSHLVYDIPQILLFFSGNYTTTFFLNYY